MKILYSFLLVGFFCISSIAQSQLGSDIDGEAAGDQSGASVSLSDDGTVMAVGARYNKHNGIDAGHVRVYQYNSEAWSQLGGDIDSEAAGDNNGSVSLSGDGTILAIGAYDNDGNGDSAGHVMVYQYDSGAWSQLGSDIDGEAAGDWSGWSISLSDDGTVLAIGAFFNDGNGENAGHVRVYQYNSGAWSQLGNDIDGEAAGDRNGYSVSLSDDGTVLAIGANNNDGNGKNSGHVRVYQYNSGAWSQLGNDIDGEAANNWIGWSVSLSKDGTVLAIGAPFNNGSAENAGHVRVFQYDSGAWSQLGSDIDGEGAGDWNGYSVSLSDDGKVLATGARYNKGNGIGAGHVRVYQYNSGAWSQLGNDIDGEAAEDESGRSVSLSADGTVLAIGAPWNDGNGVDAGHVRVFDIGNLVGIDNISKENRVSVFPNPTKRNVTVTFDESILGSTYFIYDQVGKEVLKGILNQQNMSIDLKDLTRGAYVLSIIGNYNHSLKLMKL